MTEHWNIQVSIQRVREAVTGGRAPGSRSYQDPPVKTEREVTEVLKLAVVADSETGAYAKTHRMLAANEPVYSPLPAEVTSPLAHPLPRDPGQLQISERAGIRRALLAVMERMAASVEVAEENHEALGHKPHRTGDECWNRFGPAEIEGMIDDVARQLGLPEGWAKP